MESLHDKAEVIFASLDNGQKKQAISQIKKLTRKERYGLWQYAIEFGLKREREIVGILLGDLYGL